MDYWKRFFTTENDFWPQKRVWGLFQVLNTRKITPSMSSQLVDCFKKRFSHMWNDFYIATSDKTGTEAMRGPNFATGWALPRCARTAVPPICPSGGAPCFGTFRGMPGCILYTWHLCVVYAQWRIPIRKNRRAHAQRRAGPCGAPFCARKIGFVHPNIILGT